MPRSRFQDESRRQHKQPPHIFPPAQSPRGSTPHPLPASTSASRPPPPPAESPRRGRHQTVPRLNDNANRKTRCSVSSNQSSVQTGYWLLITDYWLPLTATPLALT